MNTQKSYENPALAFMSRPRPPKDPSTETEPKIQATPDHKIDNEIVIKTDNKKINLPEYNDTPKEKKTKRFDVNLKPSVFEQLSAYAESKKISKGEAFERMVSIMTVLIESAEKNGMTLEEYHQKIIDSNT